jgi:hypothetical protein
LPAIVLALGTAPVVRRDLPPFTGLTQQPAVVSPHAGFVRTAPIASRERLPYDSEMREKSSPWRSLRRFLELRAFRFLRVVDNDQYRRRDLRIKFFSLTLAIVGGSLVLIGLHNSNEAAKAANYSRITDWVLQLDHATLAHPELVPYFEENKQILPGHEHYRSAVIMAETIMDVEDSILELQGGIENLEEDPWKEWIYDTFAESPVLRQHLARRRNWYGPLTEAFTLWERERPEQRRLAIKDDPE